MKVNKYINKSIKTCCNYIIEFGPLFFNYYIVEYDNLSMHKLA